MPGQVIKLPRVMIAEDLLRVLSESGAVYEVTTDITKLVTLARTPRTIIVIVLERDLVCPDVFTLNCAVHLAGQGASEWHQYLFCDSEGRPAHFRHGENCPQRMRLKRTSTRRTSRADQWAVQEALANFAKRLFEW